jgi:hypothetical protein
MDCFCIADYVDVCYTDTICILLLWISIPVKLDFLIGGKSVKKKMPSGPFVNIYDSFPT